MRNVQTRTETGEDEAEPYGEMPEKIDTSRRIHTQEMIVKEDRSIKDYKKY